MNKKIVEKKEDKIVKPETINAEKTSAKSTFKKKKKN